jgi:ribosomal protein S1
MSTTIQKTIIKKEINWDLLESYHSKKPNKDILNKYNEVVCNHEPYALDYFEKLFKASNVESKEPRVGEYRKIIDISYISEKDIHVSLNGFVDAIIDPKNEKHFCNMLNVTPNELVDWLKTEDGKHTFLNQGYHVVVESIKPYLKASISKGHELKMRTEFFTEIKSCTSAYYGKIREKNGGGFIINVMGIDGFLPGSLAATNIVRDFDAMIGKEIPVMVEDYLKESDTFVFSFKKYVNTILPRKIEEIDLEKKYSGVVTGMAKYGIFVEFDEIFTGLIHNSKMTPELKENISTGKVKAGTKIDFWIKEITSDKKIILTDEDPLIRRQEIEDFKEKFLGTIRDGQVISIQPFGTLVKIQKDIVGLISQKEIKSKKKNFSVGDTVMVSVDRVHNDKIFLSIPAES